MIDVRDEYPETDNFFPWKETSMYGFLLSIKHWNVELTASLFAFKMRRFRFRFCDITRELMEIIESCKDLFLTLQVKYDSRNITDIILNAVRFKKLRKSKRT